ncbi:MAG: hypothetical protein AABX53_01605 [Nanoarchaeota archaeon]
MNRRERTKLYIQDPPRRIVSPEEEHEVHPTIETFFSSARRAIESFYDVRGPDNFEIRSGEVTLPNAHVTDDRCTCLIYKDRTIAVVLARRTKSNNIEYTFSSNLEDLE